MAKPNVNYIDPAKLMAVVQELGLECKDQAGFTKVSGGNGRQVYVARTKRCGRVDLSNFTVDLPQGVTDLRGQAFGAVKQQLDFTLPEDQVIANFRTVLEAMKAMPKAEKAPRAGKTPGTATPSSEGSAPAEDDEATKRAKRLKHLETVSRISASKGIALSPELSAEIQQLVAEGVQA